MIVKINGRGTCIFWKFGNDLEREHPEFSNKLESSHSTRELKDQTKIDLIRACDGVKYQGWVLVRIVEDGDIGWVRCGWLYGE